MEINKQYISERNTYPGKNEPKYIVIHETDNFKEGSNAKIHAEAQSLGHLNDMSSHYYCGDDGIYQAARHEDGTWSIGREYGGNHAIKDASNINTINIEICVNGDGDYNVARANAIELVKYLIKTTSIPAERVIRHFDAKGKHCPRKMMDNPSLWDDFKNAIRLNNSNATQIQYTQYSKEEFIEKVAACVNAIRKDFGIEVASPIIAQACLESAYGTTNKATHNNYFGLKYRENRCPSACGTFVDGSQEQLESGEFVPITDQWFEFETLEKGIRGYFEYTSIDRYKELKGETDPKKYIEKIKAAGYATDLEYVNKVFNVITKWDLTKYDSKEESAPESTPEVEKWYRIRKSWEDAESQHNAYKNLDFAKNDCPEGYSIYDWNGVEVYSNKNVDLPKMEGKITVLEWQEAAIADGFEFPKYGADGLWGDECEGVAQIAIVKNRGKGDYRYRNLTKLVQKAVGLIGDDIDGMCYDQTEKHIIAYQKAHNLKPDGCVGINTWKVILGV